MKKQKNLEAKIAELHSEIEAAIENQIDADIAAGSIGLPRGVIRMCRVGNRCQCEAYRKMAGDRN